MAGVVTTSIVVQFGEESEDYHLSAEIDGRADGYNKGITQFFPGDSPAFLVYKSPELSLTIESSTGGISSLGTVNIEIEEYLTFANEKEKQLSKPPSGSVTVKYMAGLSGATMRDDYLALPIAGIAVYKVTYTAKAYAYRLTGVPTTLKTETSFPVVIVIVGTAV